MESRGLSEQSQAYSNRLLIPRRSCDQCRKRKISCDRGSPCSTCSSSRIQCTFGTVAPRRKPKLTNPKPSEQEQGIEHLAREIGEIKTLLRSLKPPASIARTRPTPKDRASSETATTQQVTAQGCKKPLWNHPNHVVEFVKAFVDDRQAASLNSNEATVVDSLKTVVQAIDDPRASNASFSQSGVTSNAPALSMPPQEAVVAILRWAKESRELYRLQWIAQILPLERFLEACQRLYFSVDDYSEITSILANGFLSFAFAEHVFTTGEATNLDHAKLCRTNLEIQLGRLPLLLEPSIETVAAMVLGTVYAIETSHASMAWEFVSKAMDICQTLGFHCKHRTGKLSLVAQGTSTNLFWNVYKMERSMALRLGRSSTIQDSDITITTQSAIAQKNFLSGRSTGEVYRLLYSPQGLSRPLQERYETVTKLGNNLQAIIHEQEQIIEESKLSNNCATVTQKDPMRLIYQQYDLVCQSSILALVLRAGPVTTNSESRAQCLEVARQALQRHQTAMVCLREVTNESFLIIQYLNWTILQTPFIPFNILFTHVLHSLNAEGDLARLEEFTASLKQDDTPPVPSSASSTSYEATRAASSSCSPEQPDLSSHPIENDNNGAPPSTHPHTLYDLLCKAARIYINAAHQHTPNDPTTTSDAQALCSSLSDPTIPAGYMVAGEEADMQFWDCPGEQMMQEDLGQWLHANHELYSYFT